MMDPPMLSASTSSEAPAADEVSASSAHSAVDSSSSSSSLDHHNHHDYLLFGDEPFTWTSLWVSLWNYILATCALLDFVAAWMHQRQTDRLENGEEFWEPTTTFEEAAATLAANFSNVGMIFGLLWFIDAFITARNSWIHAQQRLDRQRLLLLQNKQIQNKGLDEQNDGDAADDDEDDLQETTSCWGLEKATVVYIRTMLLQVLLLPVGFYVFAFKLGVAYMTGDDVSEYLHWFSADEHTRRFHLGIPKFHHEKRIHHHHHDHGDDDGAEDPLLVRYSNYSLLIAMVHYTVTTLAKKLHKEGKRRAKAVGVKIFARAVRKPLRFSRQLKKFLAYLRWVKYLLPIIATSNKFIQNLRDLLKKMKQKREAYLARKMRDALNRKRTPAERAQHAIVLIQKVFRAKRAFRAAAAVKILQGNREMIAAKRLQKRFRAKLEAARERIRKQKAELAALKKKQAALRKQQNAKQGEHVLEEHERARMYLLQQELKSHTDYVINKMLIRPNTKFVVWWKAAFVFAVIFEIGGKILQPRLQTKDGYESYNDLVESHVVPNRWATAPVCNPKPPKLNPHEQVIDLIATWANKTSITRSLLQLDNNQSFFVVHREPLQPTPWYCDPFPTQVQGGFCTFLEFLIRKFDIFLAFVFFLDVFISFFTGVFDEETGVLKPPAFFPRYILPGVLLQCLVNPQMETTAKILKFFFSELLLMGPVRVVRWTIALGVPILGFLFQVIRKIKHRIATQKSKVDDADGAITYDGLLKNAEMTPIQAVE